MACGCQGGQLCAEVSGAGWWHVWQEAKRVWLTGASAQARTSGAWCVHNPKTRCIANNQGGGDVPVLMDLACNQAMDKQE